MSELFPAVVCPKCNGEERPCDLCDQNVRKISPFKAEFWMAQHPDWKHDTEREMTAVREEKKP